MTEAEYEAMVEWLNERPTWDEFWCTVGSEEWLTAKALIEISNVLHDDATGWLRYRDEGRTRTPELDLREWVADVDASGRDWSSTERHLFELAASMLDRDRTISLQKVLSYTGSWEREVWTILVHWGTGGDNRGYQGRATVIPN